MILHGTSHAFATIMAFVSSALLADLIREKVPILKDIAMRLAEAMRLHLGLLLSNEAMSWLILSAFFAFIWGAAFKKMH